MKIKLKKRGLILLGIILVMNSLGIAETQINFYKNIAISQVKEYKNGNVIDNKIVINSINKPAIIGEKNLLKLLTPTLGKNIWNITNSILPITKRLCYRNDIDLCNDIYDKLYKGACHYPCITYGPKVIAFNEENNELYLSASTTAAGSGGALYFIFVADLTKKEIKFLLTTIGPFQTKLSASGNYLLLYTDESITIIKPKDDESFDLFDEINNINLKNYRLVVRNIYWLNDNQFSFQVGTRHSKFQGSFDEMKENVYDIPSRKIIRTRIMAKTEFDSTPYTEPR